MLLLSAREHLLYKDGENRGQELSGFQVPGAVFKAGILIAENELYKLELYKIFIILPTVFLGT